MPTTSIKETLEQEYERVRVLTNQATPDAFFAAIDPSIMSEQSKSEMRSGWSFAPRIFKSMMPSLQDPKIKFYKLDKQGDWAGYYYAFEYENNESPILAVRRFHYVNDRWIVADTSAVNISLEAYASMDETALEAEIKASRVMTPTPPEKD